MKKILIVFMVFLLIFPTAYASEPKEFNKNDFLEELYKEKDLSFEEIYLLQLNGYKLPAEYLEQYKKQARTESFPTAVYLANLINVLDYEGYDICNFEGMNLVEELYNYKFVAREAAQGIATVVRVLNRFDNIPPEALNNPLIQAFNLLEYQNSDGGFGSFIPEISHLETTATVLTALAPYTYIEKINKAVIKAINFLSHIQNSDGTFTSFDKQTSSTVSLVITALTELKTDPYIPDFKKSDNTLIDVLFEYILDDFTFKNVKDGKYDRNSTVIAYTALTALERLYSGQSPVYNLNDFKYEISADTFSDYNEISDNNKSYIELARTLGITQGDTNGNFNPKAGITRAEVVTALLRTVNSEITNNYESVFTDVTENSWYWNYVLTAKRKGFVNGTTYTTFEPESNITKQDVAVIITNIYPMPYDASQTFADFDSTASYAKNAVQMCIQNGIFDLYDGLFNPYSDADRETVISALVKLLMYLATE
ncbi:MAG: S-layer homology domain-containing protein [Clostridia bacterium]|nr:S-layer homology domain-containing protein [Clostridia bacterium]